MVVDIVKDIDLSSVKGILCDLDNTIYAYDPAHKSAYIKCEEIAFKNYNISKIDFESNWNAARKKVHNSLHGQAAMHSRLLYFQKLYEQIFGKTNAVFALEMESLYWDTFLNSMEWIPGIKELFEKAKERNIKMCIVTDLTTQIQLKKWIHLGLEDYMDFMISSEEAGSEKPNATIFQLALQKLELNTSDVIMIGDNYEKDIKGAEALGIKSYWIQ